MRLESERDLDIFTMKDPEDQTELKKVQGNELGKASKVKVLSINSQKNLLNSRRESNVGRGTRGEVCE